MEFKVAAKAAAASLAPAPANQGAQGRSRVSFVSGPAPTRTKALRAASNSATPVAKYVLIGLLARNRWVSRTSAALGSVWGVCRHVLARVGSDCSAVVSCDDPGIGFGCQLGELLV